MRIILIILSLLFAHASMAADSCDLGKIGLSENFSELKAKYKLDSDEVNSDMFTKNLRGSDICDTLGNAEVQFVFLNNKLVNVDIYKKSENRVLYGLAISSFGEPDRALNPNDPELRSFATFWKGEDVVRTYNFKTESDGKTVTETMALQKKEYNERMNELSNEEEENDIKVKNEE